MNVPRILVSIGLGIGLLAAEASGQRGLGRVRSMRDEPAVIAAFADLVAPFRDRVVTVERDGRVVALGTVVGAHGLILTKASELGSGDLFCTAGERRGAALRIGVDELDDLALLRVAELDLPSVPFADVPPKRGALLASPTADRAGAAVGILSSAPYRHGVDRGYLGVQMHQEPSPIRLQVVREGTAAARAGLTAEDVILALDDEDIADTAAFVDAIRARRPGQTIRLRIRRGDAELAVEATLLRDRSGERSDQEGLWGPLSEVRAGFGVVLQHDTILRPEQCGGPLVDLDGNVVGINIARAGRVETLALPVDEVLAAIARIRVAADAPRGEPAPESGVGR